MNERMQLLKPSIESILPEVEANYKDLHSNPELSMQEFRTAGIVAEYLKSLGFDVSERIGCTGVVGLLENGAGKIVMLRADMDALPMAEKTGLPYASNATGETLSLILSSVSM